MKKYSDIIIFLVVYVVFSTTYYLIYREEITRTKDYEFLIIGLIGASAVFFVPLIQKLLKK